MKSLIAMAAAACLALLVWWGWKPSPPKPSTSEDVPSPAAQAVQPAAAPAPGFQEAPAAPARSTDPNPQPKATNILAQIIKGETPDLTMEQIRPYLEANHRDAESLLTAFQATHDRALLDEALARYPNDPHVAYTAWFRAQPGEGDPEAIGARRQALDAFKQAAPDNSLANYLSAANYFKLGQPDQAVQEIQAGAGKPKFDDYVQDSIQSMQEAYLKAGYSEVEAKLAATTGALLPHLAELKQDSMRLVDLSASYRQAGNVDSAQGILQLGVELGQRLDDAGATTLIQTLVGIAIQRNTLSAIAAASPDADSSQAVQSRIDALAQRREEIKSLVSSLQLDTWLQTAPAEDVNAYLDRQRLFGEQRALQWVANRKQSQ